MPGLLELMQRTLGERINIDARGGRTLVRRSAPIGRSSKRRSSTWPSMHATPCRTAAI